MVSVHNPVVMVHMLHLKLSSQGLSLEGWSQLESVCICQVSRLDLAWINSSC